MTGSKRHTDVSWSRAFAHAAAYSLVLLVLTLYVPLKDLLVGYGGNKVLRAVFADVSAVSPLVTPIGLYALAVMAVHLLVGLVAVGLAYMTQAALPRVNATRQSLIAVWFIALSVIVVASSAALYPRSYLADYYFGLASFDVTGVKFFQLLITLTTLAALVIAVLAVRNVGLQALHRRAVPVSAGVIALAIVALWPVRPAGRAANAAQASDKPHVIIIGVDSLRIDRLGRFGGSGLTPTLDAELSNAYLFRDTISPLARTFPSWVSILTGRHPRTTGAWFNLIDRERVASYPTLGDTLRRNGYATAFATDEVRFANIDESYGFDRIVTPAIGAADFILGTLNDLPVTNLLSNTRIGAWLFPHTYANRAAASRYRPDVFVEHVHREVAFDRPTLLIVHFTVSHWPYYDASKDETDTRRYDSPGEKRFAEYLRGVKIADRQIEMLLTGLRERGVLSNALVWFVSDHGEAMALPTDSLIASREPTSRPPVQVSTYGHGTSVLSPVQYQVLMALKGYGAAAGSIASGGSLLPASLEDLSPTTLDILGVAEPQARFDGRSLRAAMGAAADAMAAGERVRFTETDFNVPRMLAGDINPGWLAIESADYYTIDPVSGWVELKGEKLPQIMAFKERAAISDDLILAALPARNSKTMYVLANRRTGEYTILERAPVPGDPAASLWQSLQSRFPGELGELRNAGSAALANTRTHTN